MVVLESPTPDVASAAVGLLDPSNTQLPLAVDTSTSSGNAAAAAVAALDESATSRGSSSMKMVAKRYTNLHNWLSLGPVSAKQLKEAMVSAFCFVSVARAAAALAAANDKVKSALLDASDLPPSNRDETTTTGTLPAT